MRALFIVLALALEFIPTLTFSADSLYAEANQSGKSYKLLKVVDISKKLSSGRVGRPDVVAIGNELYLAYGIRRKRNHHLIRMKANLNLTLIGNGPLELFLGYHDFSVDIT